MTTANGDMTWLDILELNAGGAEKIDDQAIYQTLKDCLETQDWDLNPLETGLYRFFALCWKYRPLRQEIRAAMQFWPADRRQDFIGCVEDIRADELGDRKGKKREPKEKVQSPAQEGDSDKPVIYADMTDTEKVVDQCLDVIMQSGNVLFQRDGILSIIAKSKRKSQDGAGRDVVRLKIIEPSIFYIMELATKAATWYVSPGNTMDIEKFKQGSCPKRVIEHIQSRPDLPLPILTGVVSAPTLRGDGSIISEPGYDVETGIYYEPIHEYPDIPDNPTYEEALRAVEILKGPFVDFQFESEHHKSAALSGILSIHCRHLCRTIPMHTVTSNTRGAGKGLLVNVFAVAATGQEPAKSGATRDDEEMRKSLLVIAKDGDRITVFDNVPEGPFGTPALERALTEPVIKDRILGASKSAEVALQTTFYATGNNMTYSGDMARRVVPIVIAPTTENPEQRSDFHINRLLKWTQDHHPSLVVAALTIIRAYILAGKPDQNLSQYGSFEDWSDLVRSALVWLGEPDPNEGRTSLEVEADPGYQNLQTLILAWSKAFPPSVHQKLKTVIDLVKKHSDMNERDDSRNEFFVDLGDALLAFDPKANGKVSDLSHLRVSQRLPVNSGASRVIDGLRLLKEVDKNSKVNLWWVEQPGEASKWVDDDDLPF